MREDEDLLQQHLVRRARLVAALSAGRRRSWAERRGLAPAVLAGAALAALLAFASGVTVVVQDQLAQTRAAAREQQARQEQQAADEQARRASASASAASAAASASPSPVSSPPAPAATRRPTAPAPRPARTPAAPNG